MIPQPADVRGDFVVVRDNGSSFTERAEVLVGSETETTDAADRTDAPFIVSRPMRLGGVFNQHEVVVASQFFEACEVRRLTVQVDRQQRLGPRRDGSGGQECIQRPRDRVDIHEHGRRADIRDRPARTDPGVRSRDDFVARPDAARPQSQMQR
jgi:hypothetical protein